MNTALALIAGYLLGCIPFAVITSRLFGLADPRSYGSGNPGATNVLRSGHKLAALLTLLGDALKGCAAVWLMQALGANGTEAVLAGVSAFVGHVFPATLGFKGGKGVATAAGVMLSAMPAVGAIALGLWLAVALTTRYSSLAALLAAVCAPLAAWWLGANTLQIAAFSLMAALLIVRHKDNIRRLLAGTEGRIGAKKTPAA